MVLTSLTLSFPNGVGTLDNQQTDAKFFKNTNTLEFYDSDELSMNSSLLKDRDLELYRPSCDSSSERAVQWRGF